MGLGNGQTVNVNPASSTTYTVTAANGNCTSTANATVNVVQPPVITVTPANDTMCSGNGPVTITVSGNATGYSWSDGLGNAATVVVNPAVSTAYTVTATNSVCSVTGTANVSVTQTPSVSVLPDTVSICTGGSGATLTAVGSASGYVWSGGLGAAQTVTASPSHTTIYTVTAFNGSCVATAQAVVNVSNQPAAYVTPDRLTLCAGTTTTLAADPNGTSFTWSGPNNFTGSGQTIQVSGGGVYTVTISNPGGCQGTASASASITQVSTPMVNTGNDVNITSGSQVQIDATVSNGTPPYSYVWSPATGLNNAGSSDPLASPASTTTYTVVVTDANGCTGTDHVVVTVAAAGCDTSVNPLITLNGNSFAATYYPGATYQWQLDGHNLADSTNRFIKVNEQGYYTVVVTIGSCTYTSNDAFFTGLPGLDMSYFTISPNPSDGHFTVCFETLNNRTINIRLYDVTGRLIQQAETVNTSGVHTYRFDMEHAAKGAYLLQLYSDGKMANHKLIVN
jgi:hypothetical protein